MSEITEKMAARIAAVREFAKQPANYEAGWDVIVEAYDDGQLAELIKGAKSDNGAIAMARKAVTLWKEQQANASSGDTAEGDLVARQLGEDAKTVPATVPGMAGHKPGCGCVGCKAARSKAGFPDAPGTAKVKAAQPKAPKTPNACHCGCGNSTLSKFAMGHDARFASNLKKAYLSGQVTKDDAQGQADAVSFNFGSKVRRMLDLADQEIAKAAKAEVAAGAK